MSSFSNSVFTNHIPSFLIAFGLVLALFDMVLQVQTLKDSFK